MTYVRDMNSEELTAHMVRLQATPGWHNPLDDRLWQEVQSLRVELEAARGLLELCHAELNEPADSGFEMSLRRRVGDFLTATPAPEAPVVNQQFTAEQGERQEAVCRMNTATALVQRMVECAGAQPSVATGYLRDILDALKGGDSDQQPGPDVRGLASFALELIDGAWKGGSFDGGDIQEAGVRHGLLVVEQRDESCGEHCDCAEYGFPAECYRLTPALTAHRQAQQGGSHDT